MKKNRLPLILGFFLVIRIVLAYILPVFGDESYYYIWSLHPQLSYFDHPPMVSWFIAVGHVFFPKGNPLSLRIAFIISGFFISFIWVKILKEKNFSESEIICWLILFFLNPLLGPGSVLATPDLPLVLFWTLSYYFYLKIFESKNLVWYFLLGVSLGLGFCSKYHIVLFVLAGLIYLIVSKKFSALRSTGVILTLFSGALFSSPVIIWNAQNNWASFIFQINHGFGEQNLDWSWPLGYLVAQTMIINPVIFWSHTKKSTQAMDKTFSLFQFVFFFFSSFKGVVEGNWPLTSHLHHLSQFVGVISKRLFRAAILYWLVFYLLLTLFFFLPASRDVKRNLVNSTQTAELLPYAEKYSPLYGPSYQMASLLSWKTQKAIPKLRGLSRHDFYDSLPESAPTSKTFYVLKYDLSDWPEDYAHFKKIKLQSFDNTQMALYQFTHE